MIAIPNFSPKDGLYQIDKGRIHKYKSKGGTVRVYDLIEIDEPKVGRWIDTNMTCYGAKVYKCSACDNEIDEMPTEMGEPIWNYCPNCGAKMERRADEYNTERD